MAKISLHFDTETEDKEIARQSLYDPEAYWAIEDIWNKCFRPRHKHGYHNTDVNTLINDEGEIGAAIDKVLDYIEEQYREAVDGLKKNI